jgi:transposase
MDMNFGGIVANETTENNQQAGHATESSQLLVERPQNAVNQTSENSRPVQRRRRWTAEEKKSIIDEIERQGSSTSAVARKYGISLRLLFSWRRQMRQQLLSSIPEAGSDFTGMPEAEQLKARIGELERQLGKKMVENQLLKEALGMAVVTMPNGVEQQQQQQQPLSTGS